MDIEILEKYKSKRNNVYKVQVNNCVENEAEMDKNNKILVMKRYSTNNTGIMEKEYENIKMLRKLGISIPNVIYKNSDSLFLEYIRGELVVDLIERQYIGNWIDEFALWMANLHKISNGEGKLLKMDVNLRNFIYSEGKIYGLDFEDISYGDIGTDLGNICFFIITNYPSFTREKHIIMRQFLHSYEKYSGSELKEMSKYLLKSKEEAKIRRYKSR